MVRVATEHASELRREWDGKSHPYAEKFIVQLKSALSNVVAMHRTHTRIEQGRVRERERERYR